MLKVLEKKQELFADPETIELINTATQL